MDNMIYHIYWGTAGNAGLYLDEIYQTLQKAGYKQKVFVSYYYPFDYGEKVFFKRTEMEHCRYKGLVRKVLQAYEFVVALFRILLQAFKDKPNIINYSYVNRGNALLLRFLKCIKSISHCKLVITCHDVIPIIAEKKAYNKEIAIKKRIFSLANYFFVHTEASKNELKSIFEIREEQVLTHLFPLMDLSKMDKEYNTEDIKYDFLFIGHMRQEKGIPLLIDAWETFHKNYPHTNLCIAGNPYYYKEYLSKREDWCVKNGIDLKLGFINDDDYKRRWLITIISFLLLCFKNERIYN
jgi:glycosyltransferase involved in cell wall biosynthesis